MSKPNLRGPKARSYKYRPRQWRWSERACYRPCASSNSSQALRPLGGIETQVQVPPYSSSPPPVLPVLSWGQYLRYPSEKTKNSPIVDGVRAFFVTEVIEEMLGLIGGEATAAGSFNYKKLGCLKWSEAASFCNFIFSFLFFYFYFFKLLYWL